MKILCVADHLDPLVYTAAIKERYRDVDLAIGAGDLPMSYLGFIASSLNKPVLFVFGNHNLDQYHLFHKRSALNPRMGGFGVDHQHHFGSTYIDRRVIMKKKLIFAGLGGSMRYNDGENQYTEFQMILRILSLVPKLLWNRLFRGRFVDILVTHAPPCGIHDKDDNAHRGFKSFLWFMRTFRPEIGSAHV